MKKLKVGDRVKTNSDFFGNSKIVDKIGTIIMINHDNSVCSVEFDDYIDGHDAGGYGTYGHCWGVPMRFLEHANTDRKIVITTDGKTTTAKMYDGKKLVKSAKTDCHPDDDFDFERGAGIAISRLLDWIFVPDNTLKKEELYTGKVVCVKGGYYNSFFKVGKIYHIKNGFISSEADMKFLGIKNVQSFNESNKGHGIEFLEIVE